MHHSRRPVAAASRSPAITIIATWYAENEYRPIRKLDSGVAIP